MEMDSKLITDFEEKVVNHPEGFINGNEEFKSVLKSVLKMLFDFAKSLEPQQFGELPELYTDGFDSEGIWEQLKLRVEPMLQYYKKEVSAFESAEVISTQSDEEDDEEMIESNSNDNEMKEEEEEDEMEEEEEEEEEMEEEEEEEMEEEEEEMEGDVEDSEKGSEGEDEKPLDDKALWEQMQKFGEFEEDMLAKENEDVQESDEDEIDMMKPLDEQVDEDEEEKEDDEERKSMKRQISEMEGTLLKPRSWELQGETTAAIRGENDLLGVDLDVDRIGVTAPISTVESTMTLEDLIKKRILDQAFDDPVRKAAPREKENKPSVEVSTEKSEQGLGEIYENEYMKQMKGYDKKKDEIDSKKKEIQIMFMRLCVALDRLSNANYTPEAAIKPLAVVTSSPALAMEEALPISVSSETRLAPEEIYGGDKKVLKGASEKEKEERERERRAKKEKKRAKKEIEEKELRERAVYDESARKILEKRKVKESLEAKNVTKGVTTSKSEDFKSTAFFKKLQDETSGAIEEIRGKAIEKEKKIGGASAGYKL